jgi:hypothetical protein
LYYLDGCCRDKQGRATEERRGGARRRSASSHPHDEDRGDAPEPWWYLARAAWTSPRYRDAEYQAQGNQLMQPWIDTMAEAVSTATGKRLAAVAQEMSPDAWWTNFAATFGQVIATHPEHS